MSSFRRFLDGLGLALITLFALGGPLAIGFFAFLALGDGLELNSSNPLRAGRIWLLRENRRFTALAISSIAPAAPQPTSDDAMPDNIQCARTYFTALRWSPALSLERTAGTCTCYSYVDDALRDSRIPCAAE
jgi:hypothetical protein